MLIFARVGPCQSGPARDETHVTKRAFAAQGSTGRHGADPRDGASGVLREPRGNQSSHQVGAPRHPGHPATRRGRRDRRQAAAPRLGLTPQEAADCLGVSRDSFDRHVAPELRLVRKGRLVIVPVKSIERWLEHEAALTLQSQR